MSNIPADLSPETAAWLQAQMVINNARTAAVLRAEISKVDDWANSILAALRDALGHTFFEFPGLGQTVASDWRHDAQDFELMRRGGKPAARPEATPAELEARAMLFRYFVRLGMFDDGGRQ